MNSTLGEISAKQLHAAARIKERIDELQAELNSILSLPSSYSSGPVARATTPGRRKMSAAGRAAIAAGARARWAKIKGTAPAAAPSGGRRQMSAAAKAKISAAAKLRWKKARAAGRNAL
jgi:hypothetical protein